MVGGKNQDEIIMVSSSDYDMLVATGAYEPVSDSSEEIQMKEVYGKQKSPYKRSTGNGTIVGPRTRIIVSDKEEENDSMREGVLNSPTELLDDSLFVDDSDINQYLQKQPNEQSESEGSEEGWSFS